MDFVELEDRAPHDMGGEPLLSFGLLEGLLPVAGGQLEDAVLGPAGQQAEQVAEVGFGLDFVQVAAGDQGRAERVDLGPVIAGNVTRS